jgi:cyclopropane fatty-acyl-phospholipid synthase-like methyltransferase
MSSPLKYQFDLNNLSTDLQKIDKIFNIKDVLKNSSITSKFITDYYAKSYLGYKLFHSLDDSIHMALNKDGKYSKEGFNVQAQEINDLLKDSSAKFVLELGCGRGFNLRYLAKSNPKIDFTGVDLTPLHAEIASKNNSGLKNAQIVNMSFDDIESLNKRYDAIYEVESVCHSPNMENTLTKIYNTLNEGGRYIAFDGFLKTDLDTIDKNLQDACRLVEISMAVSLPWEISRYLDLAKSIGFKVEVCEDYSEFILPNLLYFRYYSWSFFKRPNFAKFLKIFFPELLLKNAIAGYLMPYTIKHNVQGYYKIVLKK